MSAAQCTLEPVLWCQLSRKVKALISKSTYEETEGKAQTCLPILGSRWVLRVRENRSVCGSAGRAAFVTGTLELGHLWYRVEGQEKTQKEV